MCETLDLFKIAYLTRRRLTFGSQRGGLFGLGARELFVIPFLCFIIIITRLILLI